MILVTGATGNVGGALVNRLAAGGVPTRALVRSTERADDLRGYDVGIAVGTFEDAASLRAAVDGVDRVLLVTAPGETMAAQEKALLDVLVETGSRAHVVQVAVAGVDAGSGSPSRIVRAHAEVGEALRASGLPWTVLAPTSFMQNLLRRSKVVQQGLLPSVAGEGAVAHVDVRDVAAVAAHVLTTDGHDGATYTVTGPEVLTDADVAARLAEVLGREVRPHPVSPQEYVAALTGAGVPGWLADGLLELEQLQGSPDASTVTDEVAKATGGPARPLRQFLADHRAAFA